MDETNELNTTMNVSVLRMKLSLSALIGCMSLLNLFHSVNASVH